MTNLSHAIRKFNRFELKYLVTIQAAETFKRALGAYLAPDEHGDSRGSYDVASLYYDGPDFPCYWEKADGVKFRRKLRIRHYTSTGPLTDETPVFVEIKQRLNRVTQKRRVALPYQAALRLCDGRQMPDPNEFARAPHEAAVIDEIASLAWQYDLRRASVIRYARQALVGADYDIGLRVTFDRDLSYSVTSLDLGDWQSGLALFPPGWVVVEIKVNERIPYWLTELVAAHNLNLARLSKYCRSIELAHNLPGAAWRPAPAPGPVA